MNRTSVKMQTIILGILTFIPSAYAIVFVIQLNAAMLGFWQPTIETIPHTMITVAVMGVWSIALGGFYAHHYLHNERIPIGKRKLGNALSLVGNLYEMPRYWYAHFVCHDVGYTHNLKDADGP